MKIREATYKLNTTGYNVMPHSNGRELLVYHGSKMVKSLTIDHKNREVDDIIIQKLQCVKWDNGVAIDARSRRIAV